MPKSVESTEGGVPSSGDRQGYRHFGDGFAGDLVAARIQGYDSSSLAYVDVAVDSNGNLKLAANVTVDLGTVDQGAAGTQAWKVTDAALAALTDGTQRVGGTVAVSAVSLPLPAGASTETTLAAVNTKLGGTLAVSAASLPLPSGAATDATLTNGNQRVGGTVAVTGSFFQATQPVSLASLPALAAGSAVIGHVIVDTAPSTAVTNTGTFAVQAALNAETTKVIGTVNVSAGQTIAVTGSPGRSWTLASGSDSVTVGNFPASQPVSGTVSVSNLPALGSALEAASIPVVVASDQTVPVLDATADENLAAIREALNVLAFQSMLDAEEFLCPT